MLIWKQKNKDPYLPCSQNVNTTRGYDSIFLFFNYQRGRARDVELDVGATPIILREPLKFTARCGRFLGFKENGFYAIFHN